MTRRLLSSVICAATIGACGVLCYEVGLAVGLALIITLGWAAAFVIGIVALRLDAQRKRAAPDARRNRLEFNA